MFMTDQEFEDAKSLWKFFYARECFRQVESTVQQMLALKLDTHHEIYYPLLVSIYVLYGKPFKNANIVGKLSNDIVPKEHLELHGNLIEHRDQLYAHTDADGREIANRGKLNQVRFLVTEIEQPEGIQREFRLFAPQFKARPILLPNLAQLCKILMAKADKQINELQARNVSCIPMGAGEYTINVLDKDGAFVIKSTPFLAR
jgi:hypothetical protein